MPRRLTLAHAFSTNQANLSIKLHGENAPALPAAGKGQSGRVLLRPQRNHHAASPAEFCTAVSSQVEEPWRAARTPGDLVIRWTRRSRALAADSWTAPEVPLAEETEAYEVEILDGATVKRTLSTATTSVTYAAAQQTADWGALLGPGDTLDIRIFQLSALVGRGASKPVTLQF
jgi:hypothetical protein